MPEQGQKCPSERTSLCLRHSFQASPKMGKNRSINREGLKPLFFFCFFLLRHVYCYNWPKYFNSHKDMSPPVSAMSKCHRVTSLRWLLTLVSAITTHGLGRHSTEPVAGGVTPILPSPVSIYICKIGIRNKTIVSVLKLNLTKILSCCCLRKRPENSLSPELYYPQTRNVIISLCHPGFCLLLFEFSPKTFFLQP